MKKLLTIFAVIGFQSFFSQSQAQTYTLEQIDLSPAIGTNYNTYVMDINNRGFMVGYFTDNNGYNTGLIITRKGVMFYIDNNVIVGSSDVKVVSINDNDVALVSSTMGGVTSLYKIYVADEAVSAPVSVSGLGQNPINALKINNKNDISGWYQGVNSRWLFVLHDSIIPAAMPLWQASRYMPAATYYNTWGCGMDTNNNIAGFYLDAPNYYPFLYNATANTYQLLTAPAKTKIWDMNNSHMMVGEYQQGNGTYMAFWGDITGNTLNVNSLANIFHNTTIQSVANGVNDNGVVVGSFYDPNVSKWKGFVYRPGPGKYEYPGYSFYQHTWHEGNWDDTTAGNTDSHWNDDFFIQNIVDYSVFDTYMHNGIPLYDSLMKKRWKQAAVPIWFHPDWKSFATETDKLYSPNGTPQDKIIYQSFKKYKIFAKWIKYIQKQDNGGEFTGDCFGFTSTSLMSYCDPLILSNRFGIPVGTNLSTVTNMDSLGKSAITRTQLLFGNRNLLNLDDPIYPWLGLYRTKTYMMDPLQKVNIRTLGFQLVDGTDTGSHAVFPYAIRTPQKLPFTDPVTLLTQQDTIFIYDPNAPHDSTRFVTAGSNWVYNMDSFFSPNYYIISMTFSYPTFTQMQNTPFAALKKIRAIDTTYDFYFSAGTDYMIENAGATCYQQNNVYTNGITKLIPFKGTGVKAFRPLYFTADSVDAYNITLDNYADSIMSVSHTTDDLTMGIIRKALPGETDNFSVQRKRISYGNPENISKDLTCHYVQTSDGAPQAINLVVDNMILTPNDSIITLSPYDYSYQIIHPGGDSIVYNVELYALFNDTVKHFSTGGIVLTTNTSHLIDPYYNGANGNQTVIYVDNGLNGSNDDTLFIQEVALGVGETFKNVSYVSLYPNPAHDEVNISIVDAKENHYTIVLADIYGKVLDRQEIQHAGGTGRYGISLKNNAAGTYYVVVYNKDHKALFVEKLIRE